MNLEIHHIAKRLPFGVKVDIGNYTEKSIELSFEDLTVYTLESIKPILHPLSDLNKEIIHKGETFVPIEKLEEIYGTDGHEDNWIIDAIIDNHSWMQADSDNITTGTMNLLLSWHFDVDNLIDNGLAIDVNTLEINPYEQ